MPGFELGHLLVIFFVAFLVLGPNRMFEIARGLGQFTQQAQGEWWKFSQAFQEGLKDTPDTTVEPTATPTATETAAASSETDSTAGSVETSPTPALATSEPAVAVSKVTGASQRRSRKQAKPTAQSIPEHLLELRQRLITSLLAIIVLTTIAYIFRETILYILRAPAGSLKLQALSPMDGFLIYFRVALYAGIFLSAPVWIYEATMFILPGLNPSEKRLIVPGIIATVVLFLLGNVFGYLMLQNMMGFILGMFGSELNYLPSADPFISFVVFFLLASGISFELPIVLLILIRIGWLSPDTLRKQRKISYFIIFVFAELITPVSDPFVAPTIVMMPMVVLFELALLVARFIAPKSTTISATSHPPAAS